MRPTLVPPVRRGIAGRWPGRGLRNGGLGYGGYGGDFGTDAAFATPGFAPAASPSGYEPEAAPAPQPPRCVHPLIISIGSGLRHVARTRIVYGRPPACVE